MRVWTASQYLPASVRYPSTSIRRIWRLHGMEARQLAPATRLVLSFGARQQSLSFIDGTEYRIGRDAACDFELLRPLASRHDARIVCRRQAFWLFDESSNGTFVPVMGHWMDQLR